MKRLALIFCCSVGIHFWIGTLFAQESNLIQAARREGRVVWYTVAGESQQLALEFEKKYPFVKVEVVRSTVYPLLNRILNEARTGNHLFDVVRQSTFTFAQLIQKGLVQPYESPEREGFSAGWKDKQGYWTSTDDNYFVVGYNTRLVSERDAPRDWEDLLLPKWRGQIGLDPDNHLLFGGLEQSWGREKALAYFRKLAQQQIQFRKGEHFDRPAHCRRRISIGYRLRAPSGAFQVAESAHGLGIDDESHHHHRRTPRFSSQGAASKRRKAFDRFYSLEERPNATAKLLPHSVASGSGTALRQARPAPAAPAPDVAQCSRKRRRLEKAVSLDLWHPRLARDYQDRALMWTASRTGLNFMAKNYGFSPG